MAPPKILSPLYSHGSLEDKLTSLLNDHPLPKGMAYEYGTAGFRYEASLLPCCFVRMGLFSALRSASTGGEEVGVMVTASHNPEPDNGMKLADPHGGMLDADWEHHAVSLANAPDAKHVISLIRTLRRHSNWTDGAARPKMAVHVGRDTRPHSGPLASLVVRAARLLGATVIDHGEVTTPQLHHFVMHANGHKLPGLIPQRCNESGYFETMCGSYASLLRTANFGDSEPEGRSLLVDCACGVGAPKVNEIRSRLAKLRSEGCPGLPALRAVNHPGDGPLNDACGAEYVQKQQLAPRIYTKGEEHATRSYVASLDGDADRIVFHCGEGRTFRLLDGDKIAVLVSAFVQEELRHLDDGGSGTVKCGVVQTAYANGSSTAYLKHNVKTNVVIAKTGVKFVHAAAHDHFDVGVYFEANGHGTVLFGPKFFDFLARAESRLRGSKRDDRANVALRRLRVLPSLINQAVGDALSDMLLVDAILYLRRWDLPTWGGLYTDLPSRQCKVKVLDRTVIGTNHNETKAVAPSNLQPALEASMKAMDAQSSAGEGVARCFVRPSGTENVVRVYAEASTQGDADALATEAAALVNKLCGGVGNPPSFVRNRL